VRLYTLPVAIARPVTVTSRQFLAEVLIGDDPTPVTVEIAPGVVVIPTTAQRNGGTCSLPLALRICQLLSRQHSNPTRTHTGPPTPKTHARPHALAAPEHPEPIAHPDRIFCGVSVNPREG